MKKLKTIIALAALAASGAASGSTVLLNTPAGFQILGLSPNGQWACGVYVDAVQETYAFRWNLSSGEIEMLSAGVSVAWDVANDGRISGEFMDAAVFDNGAPIQMPGLWQNGSWKHLEIPAGRITEAFGAGISADGEYLAGNICVDGTYRPYIWHGTDLWRELTSPDLGGVVYAVAPEGRGAAGWNMMRNRTAVYWNEEGAPTYLEDAPEPYGPWNYGRNFSPDGTKMVYWGGWAPDKESGQNWLYAIYDVETGERIKIKAPMSSDLEFFDISNDCTLVGGDGGRGVVCYDGEIMTIDDYLSWRGVDMSEFDDFYNEEDSPYGEAYPIYRVVAISEDENILAMQYYSRSTGSLASLVVKIDQDHAAPAPVEVKARQLEGLGCTELTWHAPAGVEGIRGYHIYRDGKKLTGYLPVNRLYHYDANLEPGTYEYVVSAVTTSGVETKAEPVSLEIADSPREGVYGIVARTKGVNDAKITWSAPMSSAVHKHYHTPGADAVDGFNVYEPAEVEIAVKYDKAEMACYKEGYQVTEVSFMPMAEQGAWTVNLYTTDTSGRLVNIGGQKVDGNLKYRELNRVILDEPVDLPDGDLIVAVAVSVTDTGSSVFGAEPGKVVAGRSDLIRLASDDEYMSVYESSIETGYYVTALTWVLDLGLGAADGEETAADTPEAYNVYVDGELAGQADDTCYEVSALEDGVHTVAVEAVYSDSEVSPRVETTFKMASRWPSVDKVNVNVGEQGSTEIAATWTAPIAEDSKDVAYTSASEPVSGLMGTSSNDYSFMVASEYGRDMLRGYSGHLIQSYSFYPMTDALYTFILYKDGKKIHEIEVDEYVVNEWNEYPLDEDIVINENSVYRLVVDCFSPTPETSVLGVDDTYPRPYVSDLYSIDNGETWNSLTFETGLSGNWLIGMVISDGVEIPVEIAGYDVVIDGEARNDDKVESTEFSYDFGSSDKKLHSLRVDTWFAERQDAVRGASTFFYLAASSIENGIVTPITLNRGDNWLVAEGDGVESVEVYSAAGIKMASAKGDRVAIGHLDKGVYVVRINAGSRTKTAKIVINK